MSEDIKLFVSCHKLDTHIPDNALLQPIQVGAALAASRMPNLLHDDEGDSISELIQLDAHGTLLRSCETYREIALSQLSAAELGEEG